MANIQNLKAPWKKGESGNPNGRPKNRVNDQLAIIMPKSKVKRYFSLTMEEVNDWEKTILTLPLYALKALAKYEDAPAYPKGLAIAVISDMRNGKTTTLDKLRDRQFGKAPERIEVQPVESFEDMLIKSSLMEQELDAELDAEGWKPGQYN